MRNKQTLYLASFRTLKFNLQERKNCFAYVSLWVNKKREGVLSLQTFINSEGKPEMQTTRAGLHSPSFTPLLSTHIRLIMKFNLGIFLCLLSIASSESFCPSRAADAKEQTDIFYQFVRKFYINKDVKTAFAEHFGSRLHRAQSERGIGVDSLKYHRARRFRRIGELLHPSRYFLQQHWICAFPRRCGRRATDRCGGHIEI